MSRVFMGTHGFSGGYSLVCVGWHWFSLVVFVAFPLHEGGLTPEGGITPFGGSAGHQASRPAVPGTVRDRALWGGSSARACEFVARSCSVSMGRVMEPGAAVWERCECAAFGWVVSMQAWCSGALCCGVWWRSWRVCVRVLCRVLTSLESMAASVRVRRSAGAHGLRRGVGRRSEDDG